MVQAMRQGGCNCGQVRLEMRDEPIRVGLCHCLTCRKETGGPFMAFAVWRRHQVTVSGETRSWIALTDHRHFCPHCGSALFGAIDANDEIEVRLGCLDDAPSNLLPQYELWVSRREIWQHAVQGVMQHAGNRPG
jgi:hypothetical protein